jgi:hypothetical protein
MEKRNQLPNHWFLPWGKKLRHPLKRNRSQLQGLSDYNEGKNPNAPDEKSNLGLQDHKSATLLKYRMQQVISASSHARKFENKIYKFPLFSATIWKYYANNSVG